MDSLYRQVKIQINPKLYLKDPDTSKLGRNLLENSIELMEELGFEGFTFKKIGLRIGSPESTIYRYFENKHKLLLYLISWYWGWQEYRLVFGTANISDPQDKLMRAIGLIAEPVQADANFSYINEEKLYRIVVNESPKAYFTKDVDTDNAEGYFGAYKRLVKRLSEMVTSIKPDYPYPCALVTTMLEGAHQHRFYGQHLPVLSEAGASEASLTDFLSRLVMGSLLPYPA
jgi:AcrR family transcriptional regulator